MTDAERTVLSIATMLGWANVPPRATLEADIRALKARARDVELTGPCRWTPEDGIYTSGCGKQFVPDDGSIEWMLFCFYCGRRVLPCGEGA